MALANFIDRAATAASHVLADFSASAFKSRLEAQVVALAVDVSAASSREAIWTAQLAVDLLARLYPTLAVVAVDGGAEGLAVELRAHALAINPAITIRDSLEGATTCLAVGDAHVSTPCPIRFLGSDRWRARLSSVGPVGSGFSDIPFGAGAAACFGAANVFRSVFADQIEKGDPDVALDLSLFDYSQNGEHGPDISEVDLGETHLVGVGAIGNGMLWAFKRAPWLAGVLHLIDHETVDLSNLQRYVLAAQTHVHDRKVDMARAALEGAGSTSGPTQ